MPRNQTADSTHKPAHACGMCDGPLHWLRKEAGYDTWECTRCGWWHISKDCCEAR